LNEILASGRAANTHERAAGSGVVVWRALAIEIRKEFDRARSANGLAERRQQRGGRRRHDARKPGERGGRRQHHAHLVPETWKRMTESVHSRRRRRRKTVSDTKHDT